MTNEPETPPESKTELAAALPEFEMETTSGSLMLAGGAAFAHIQRVAKLFAASDLVPDAFRGKAANCTIALEMAHRMGANPMAVMQNLYIVHGRPGWSAQFIVACLNQCGKFSPIRFDISGDGESRECIAWAIEKETGERLEGPAVTMRMAKEEGWSTKAGSKWKTMPDLMLRYRAATFFGRLYAPDLLMGMQTTDEIADVGELRQAKEVKKARIPLLPDKPAPQEPPTTAREEVEGLAKAAGFDDSFEVIRVMSALEIIKGRVESVDEVSPSEWAQAAARWDEIQIELDARK